MQSGALLFPYFPNCFLIFVTGKGSQDVSLYRTRYCKM